MRRVGLPLVLLLAVGFLSGWLLAVKARDQRSARHAAAASGKDRLPHRERSLLPPETNRATRTEAGGESGDGPEDSEDPAAFAIRGWQRVDDLPEPITVFETVFWQPEDSSSLRKMIAGEASVRGKTVLEIGTGTGLVSLCCLRAGAAKVVATEINPAAVANALYNARRLGLADRLEVRQVPIERPGAFSVIGESERFDLIVSNPPWENDRPESVDKYAYFDPDFQLLESLLAGLEDHLRPGGLALVAYGSVDAIGALQRLAPRFGLETRTADRRSLQALPLVFLPGMLIEIMPNAASSVPPGGSGASLPQAAEHPGEPAEGF